MSISVKLTTAIRWHNSSITQITLREPTYRDFIEFGEPTTWVSVAGGGAFLNEDTEKIAQYIERLADCEVNALQKLSLKDTLALRGAVRSFFISSGEQDRAEPKPSTDSSDTLSSKTETESGPSTI